MERLTTTPFGRRPVTAALIEQAEAARGPARLQSVDKWKVFRALCVGKAHFGVRDRDLTVLNALLSFLRDSTLSEDASLIVFPSNATLSDRAHGMAESTLRRHLAVLVRAGLILRHDSPNGKRYARRDREGTVIRAFGFDLKPLLVRAPEIFQAATVARDAAHRRQEIRERAVLAKRDAEKLIDFALETNRTGNWDALSDRCRLLARGLRRKLDEAALEQLLDDFTTLLDEVQSLLGTAEMGGSDSQNERHLQSSNMDKSDSETLEQREGQGGTVHKITERPRRRDAKNTSFNPPLALVLQACPDIAAFCPHEVRNWRDLVRTADDLRVMMGIDTGVWHEACEKMGPQSAAIVVCSILQRFQVIRSHGGYLRALSRKAATGAFSPGPMVMALLNGQKAAA